MAHGDYTVIAVGKPKAPKENLIPKPEGFVFDSDEGAKHGQLVTVRVKAEPNDDTKLCVTEIEGMKMLGYGDDEESESTPDDEEVE